MSQIRPQRCFAHDGVVSAVSGVVSPVLGVISTSGRVFERNLRPNATNSSACTQNTAYAERRVAPVDMDMISREIPSFEVRRPIRADMERWTFMSDVSLPLLTWFTRTSGPATTSTGGRRRPRCRGRG